MKRIALILTWVALSGLGSMARREFKGCDKVYPLDYILYTKWFCEIKGR